jgi:hypothetical protein
MNKRQFKKIITLYREGLSCEICIAVIIDLMQNKSNIEKGIAIHEFYESIFTLTEK